MPRILVMRRLGSTLAEIGWIYGVSAGTISSVLLEHGAPPELINFAKPEVIARICLCCRRRFDAPGRFVRLCTSCKKTNDL